MENFRDMANQFLAAKAGVQVTSGQQLGKVWVQLIEDNPLRERMGKAARQLSERNRGATDRAIDRITVLLDGEGRGE
jgi:3-deoxy-D-manno-octulosonic-acid transferase